MKFEIDHGGGIESIAAFSSCGKYRYMLGRVWNQHLPTVTFCMLNPSTADHKYDDPTSRRVIGFAKAWGYGGVFLVNAFAFRATDPADLKRAADPVGQENTFYTLECAKRSGKLVVAWGAHGSFLLRDVAVIQALRNAGISPYCLGRNRDGSPKHPLYIKGSVRPEPFEDRYIWKAVTDDRVRGS